MEEKDCYELQIVGVVKANDNSLITEMIEVLYEENGELKWITLVTDVSATTDPQLKIIVDGILQDDIIKIYFNTYEELQTIKCIRITAMVFETEKRKLLHIARKTIGVNFNSCDKKMYRVSAIINFPFLVLENEKQSELIMRSCEDMKQCEKIKMMEYHTGSYAEYDMYDKCIHKEKIYIPLKKANVYIEDCFPGIKNIMNMYGIEKWNFVNYEKLCVCNAIDVF